MNVFSVATLVVALAALAASGSAPAGAIGSLQRCEGPEGEVIYTDQACAALGAQTMPLPSELLTRIASEEDAYTQRINFAEVQAVASVGRRSSTSGCARSKRQLARDIQGSLALHDVNRLAESYHWVGKSNREARQHMIRLERMATQRLNDDAELFHEQARVGNDPTQLEDEAMTGPSGGIVQLTFGNGSSQQVMDLEVLRYSGCYFARL